MIPTNPASTAPPEDLVKREFNNPEIYRLLLCHALAILNHKLADQPRARRQQEAEEVVQIVLQRAWQARQQYDPERAGLSAWLHGFLVRVVAEQCRAIRKRPTSLNHYPDDWIDKNEHQYDQDPLAMLEHLPPEDRVAVEGFYLQNLSHRQIADRLRISEGTARVRLLRALNKLRQIAGEVRQ